MDMLSNILGLFGEGVLSVYQAFSFTIYGVTINALDVVLWFTIAYFVIDLIRDFSDL